MLYHLCTRAELVRDTNETDYVPLSLSTIGFVHLARGEQVTLAVAKSYYWTREDPVLVLAIDPAQVPGEVRDEAPAPPDGQVHPHHALAETFPHLYGLVPRAAITGVGELGRDDDGFTWPEAMTPLSDYLSRR